MKVTLLRPDKLSMEQIKIFRGIVVSGGQIPLELVDRGIKRADRLALCEIDDEIVGVASIKNPTDAYKIRVFKKAGVEHLANKYDLEIGYVVTKVKYRGRGISPKLIEMLIENSKSTSFYATTKVDTMRKILERLRFEKTGADYYNDDKEAVSLYIFSKPTTEKLAESDELFLLRYRYGRAAEMHIAYKTFLHREVIIGENSYCQNNEMVRQVTHTGTGI